MTSSTKRKHVVRELLEDYSLPNYENSESIVKVVSSPGSNLHEVISENGEKYLASLPTKFRKNVWIKRGDFVVVEPIMEGEKVKAEIVRILYPQHIKYIKDEGYWPKSFMSKEGKLEEKMKSCKISATEHVDEKKVESGDDYESSDDDFSDIPANTNRPNVYYEEESDSSEYDTEDDEEEI